MIEFAIFLTKGKYTMNYKQLTENERYQISVMKKAGHSQKEISEWLGRSASTVSRALRRNRGLRGYRPCLPAAGRIATLIRQALSPEQVVDYLALHKHLSLRHETVYRPACCRQADLRG